MTQIDDRTSETVQPETVQLETVQPETVPPEPWEDGWSEQTFTGSPEVPVVEAPASTGERRRTAAGRTTPGRASAGAAGGQGLRLRRTGARRVPFAVLLLGVLAGGMCALLALNTATAASEVRERRLDAANANSNAVQEELSRTISGLQAPAQLARMAAALGMVPAGSPAYLRINADGTVTVLGHPQAIAAPRKVVKLTPEQKAAAKAAKAKAVKAKAAKANAAKAKAPTGKVATGTTAKGTTAKGTTAKGTTAKGTTASNGTSPSTSASPAKTETTSPPTTSPTTTATIPGGPR